MPPDLTLTLSFHPLGTPADTLMLRTITCFALLAAANQVAAKDYPDTLQLEVFSPCRGNASFCAPRILARGIIDDGASDRLKSMLDERPGSTVVFDSPGGSLQEGLRIGLLLRSRGLDTAMAPEYSEELPPDSPETFRVVATDTECFSACAYAFMGGASRTLEEGARIGVHQFHGGTNDSGEAAAQVMTSVLSQYVVAMGIDRQVLDIAGLTGSTEISVISRDDAVRYNLDNQHPALAAWRLDALDNGELVARIEQQLPGSDRTTRLIVTTLGEKKETLAITVGHGSLEGQDSDRILEAISDNRKAQFCITDGDCIPAVSYKAWKYSPERHSITATFFVDSISFIKLLPQGALTFDAGFASAYSDLWPNVEIGQEGLRKALLALAR